MIPIGSEIISAKLILFMDRTAVGTYPIAAHRLLNNWGESSSIGARGGGLGGPAEEGDTTWLHRFSQMFYGKIRAATLFKSQAQ